MEKKSRSIFIDFEPISRRILVSKDSSIYELLDEINVPIRSICGGSGKCGKCRILIQKGNEFLNMPTNNEKNFINETEIQNGWRLACETRIKLKESSTLPKTKSPQIRIFLPNQLLLEDFKILTSGINKGIQLQPAVEKIFLEVKKPSLKDPTADFERIEKEIFSKMKNYKKTDKIHIDLNVLNDIPPALKKEENLYL